MKLFREYEKELNNLLYENREVTFDLSQFKDKSNVEEWLENISLHDFSVNINNNIVKVKDSLEIF